MPIRSSDRSLPDWLTRVRTGQTKLPRFQRWEAWSHSNVSQLFNTIVQDLPAGSVLVLEIGVEEPFPSRSIEGAPSPTERTTEHLLDGQQRLTALWRGLKNNYEDRTYFLNMRRDEETKMDYFIDSVSRGSRRSDGKRTPLWADEPVGQWERRMIPLEVLSPTEEGRKAYNEWVRQAISDPDEREDIRDTVEIVRTKFSGFNLPYLALPTETEPHTALEVFIRTNTTAEPLGDYDIVVALVEAKAGQSLHDLVAETKETCPEITRYYSAEDLALAAGALLQNLRPGKATYFDSKFSDNIVTNWRRYCDGVRRAASFLRDERIYDSARLPSDVVVPMLVALWADAPEGLDAEGRARAILRKFMWRAFFTRRYELSTGTRSLTDYGQLQSYIADPNAMRPDIFDAEANPLPEVNELIEAGWPKKKDRLGRAVLALSLRHGGLDLADGSPANAENLAKREYHHLFPSAHLESKSVPSSKIFRALNCALVSWRTNRNISDKDPEKYLSERRLPESPSDWQVKERLLSHLIPYEEMVNNDYHVFLERRAEMVSAEMFNLCN